MDQDITLTILTISAIATLVCMVVLRRPYVPGKPPLLPWNGMLFAALMVAVMSAVHLLGLAGWRQ